jgi:hypothetical protein
LLVANQPRTKAKPITTHQLFPAVVALWFGALFGLGSLAVRPSLIESLVLSSRLDLLVPAAAPPLGVTARILIALTLAAIGSAIGIVFARRIARPKPEARERKRSAFAPEPDVSVRQPYANAAAVVDELEPVSPVGILAARRRSLALEEDEVSFVPHDMAPLPGGAPQILDISSVGLSADSADSAQDEDNLAERTDFAAPVSGLSNLDSQAEAAAEAAAAAADGRQVFGQPVQHQPAPAPRQIFGQPIEGDHVSSDFIKAAGFRTTVFETPEPEPLFPARQETATADSVMPVASTAYDTPEVPAFTVPEATIPVSSIDASELPAKAEEAEVQATQMAKPDLPSPAGLGMDDLAARLAESMARRRAARSNRTAEPAPLPTGIVPEAVAVEAPVETPVAPAPEPETAAEQVIAETVEAASLAADPVVATSPVEAVETPVAMAPPAIPAAMRPLDLDGFEEDADAFASLLPPRKIAFPEAIAPAPLQVPVSQTLPDEAEAPLDETTEENYASLLELAPLALINTAPVRIEEPEQDAGEVEPVVIFPGQMARPTSENELASFRRFDAPAQAGQGQPVEVAEMAPAVDREESERALRLALANLQRMSGAA